MNDDMPWVDLTPEEVQELRSKKQQLTEYGKEKIRQLMNNQEPYPDAMFEEAERREAANKALDKLYAENGDALKQLAEIERQELINEALEELNAIVLGGQNTREFYLSVSHIRNVLERLK
jgi:vacuolar-type H+-ATPase subunit H